MHNVKVLSLGFQGHSLEVHGLRLLRNIAYDAELRVHPHGRSCVGGLTLRVLTPNAGLKDSGAWPGIPNVEMISKILA